MNLYKVVKSHLLVTLMVLVFNVGYTQEVFFFSEATDTTFYDQGIVDVGNLEESSFEHTHPPGSPQYNDKVPASTAAYIGATSLKFNYTSAENGNWKATIYRNDWSAVDVTQLDSVSFYIYSENDLPASALPLIGLRAVNSVGSADVNSVLYPLAEYNEDVPAGEWTHIRFPLNRFFGDPDNSQLNFSAVKGVIFNQSESDSSSHLLFIDEISAYRSIDEIPGIEMLTATGYDSHAELNWTFPLPDLTYRIYASYDGGQNFEVHAETTEDYYIDFVPDSARNSTVTYRITTLFQERESEFVEATAEIKDFSDEELLNMVQRYTFRYFWDGAHNPTGMALERSNGNDNTVASGATGMGLMAMIVAHEREYEPQENIKERILLILDFLENTERYHGAWSHWYNAEIWETQPFTPDDDGGDIVETSFVAAALIALRNYFTGTDVESVQIRETADKLWKEIEWDWYRNGLNVLIWHWSPNIGFQKNMHVRGWNEALITYIMAASSPTHGIPLKTYVQGWARNGAMVNLRSFYSHQISLAPNWGGPLFWTHYTHLGIDPRGLQDEYADYWQEHVNTALIHHAYALENPSDHENYSEKNWGLTASDDPFGYTAHQPVSNDNGTISPTAALSSMPYVPEESLSALKYFYRERGQELFGIYGFYDAFNDNYDWVQDGYIGIDQGPIVVMIENHRTGLLWELVMQDADVQAGLDKLGFQYQVPTAVSSVDLNNDFLLYPNPANHTVHFTLPDAGGKEPVVMKIYSVGGQLQMTKQLFPDGKEFSAVVANLQDGHYILQLIQDGKYQRAKFVVNK